MNRQQRKTIAVFGGSLAPEGEQLYRRARLLGAALATGGFAVANGAYGGVMEAVGRGAHEVGGHVHGVGCNIFSSREPHPYVSELQMTDDLYDRTRRLIEIADGCVVLDGKSGTLAEFSQVWALHRAGCVGRYPVVFLSAAWSQLYEMMVEQQLIEPDQQAMTHCIEHPDDVDEAVRCLRRHLTEK